MGLIALAPFAALSPDTGRRWFKKLTKGEGWFSRRLGKLLAADDRSAERRSSTSATTGIRHTFESIGYKRFVDRPDIDGEDVQAQAIPKRMSQASGEVQWIRTVSSRTSSRPTT